MPIYNRRIWICWNPYVIDISILVVCAQVISVHMVNLQSDGECNFVEIHGYNNLEHKIKLWRFIGDFVIKIVALFSFVEVSTLPCTLKPSGSSSNYGRNPQFCKVFGRE